MRQLKFRGKVIHSRSHQNNQWIYGMPTIFRDGSAAIRWQCSDKAKNPTGWKTQSVKPETLGQYTGLKDGKGNEIFEGDIVESYVATFTEDKEFLEFWRVGEIRFAAGGFVMSNCTNYDDIGMEVKSDIQPGRRSKYTFPAYRSKVIGNIFDNPELLKGGKS